MLEIENVEIDLTSLKTNEMSLEHLNSRLKCKLVSQFGPPHKPSFVMAAKVNGEEYYALDSSKKKAINNVTEKVFQVLKNHLKKVSVKSNKGNQFNIIIMQKCVFFVFRITC